MHQVLTNVSNRRIIFIVQRRFANTGAKVDNKRFDYIKSILVATARGRTLLKIATGRGCVVAELEEIMKRCSIDAQEVRAFLGVVAEKENAVYHQRFGACAAPTQLATLGDAFARLSLS